MSDSGNLSPAVIQALLDLYKAGVVFAADFEDTPLERAVAAVTRAVDDHEMSSS